MLILFSDIDGTITNRSTHSFEGSDKWIKLIIENKIPVIFVSSKTFLEIRHIQHELRISQPFIFENGSAIAFPNWYNLEKNTDFSYETSEDFNIIPLIPGEFNIKICTEIISELYKNKFITISEGDFNQLMVITGLSEAELDYARHRKFSETYIFDPAATIFIDQINRALTSVNAFAVKGSRFITVTHKYASKGFAISRFLQILKSLNPTEQQQTINTISIGDAPNDFSMLKETDISFYLSDNKALQEQVKDFIIVYPAGPQGFIKICQKILEEIAV